MCCCLLALLPLADSLVPTPAHALVPMPALSSFTVSCPLTHPALVRLRVLVAGRQRARLPVPVCSESRGSEGPVSQAVNDPSIGYVGRHATKPKAFPPLAVAAHGMKAQRKRVAGFPAGAGFQRSAGGMARGPCWVVGALDKGGYWDLSIKRKPTLFSSCTV